MTDHNKDLLMQLEAIIDTAIDGILTIDTRGKVEKMNPAAASLFGYQSKDVIGQNIRMLMPEPYHSEHDGYLHIVELNKNLEHTVSERTYELEKTVNKLLSTNKAYESEIKERKLAELKLKDIQEELMVSLSKEKELNEMKSRFVSMASHEFRTPLTSILSSAAIIGRYTKEDQQGNREKHINRIKSSVANLTGILNDFLSLSKLEEGRVEINLSELNLEELCKEIIEDTKQLLKTDQKIIHTVHGSF